MMLRSGSITSVLLLQAAAEKKAVSRERAKAEVEGRKTLFVHVRLNRVHCRVTYQVPSHSACQTCLPACMGDALVRKRWVPEKGRSVHHRTNAIATRLSPGCCIDRTAKSQITIQK